MKNTTLITKKDIIIKKGTVIPNLSNMGDCPIDYEIEIPSGSTMIKNENNYTVNITNNKGSFSYPYHPPIFNYIFDLAVNDGAKPDTIKDDLNAIHHVTIRVGNVTDCGLKIKLVDNEGNKEPKFSMFSPDVTCEKCNSLKNPYGWTFFSKP